MMKLPDPASVFPNPDLKNMCYVKNVIKTANISVGDYTYYDDPVDSTRFEENCVLFHWPEFGDRLIIGKFCAIAWGTKFLMGSANHRTSSASTYPFAVFGGEWERVVPPHMAQLPRKGDLVVGNDVWIGRECLIMPGVKIGNGAIIASRSVVTKDVEPYTVVGGNPARVLKKRFDDELIALLEAVQWWDFAPEALVEILPVLCDPDLTAVKRHLQKLIV